MIEIYIFFSYVFIVDARDGVVVDLLLPASAPLLLLEELGHTQHPKCKEDDIKLKIQVLREDTHKKGVFFSGRATKGVGRVNPPDHSAKNNFF